MSDKQLLSRSCHEAATFPKNTIRSNTSRHHLEGYFQKLNENEDRLFCEDGKADLNLFEYDNNTKEFKNRRIADANELKTCLEGQKLYVHEDSRFRAVFVHAPNSRECLQVSREMITRVLTHHQVMPNFLDFVFPFGYQEYAEDFQFSGFREDTRLLLSDGGLQIPELGRSGLEIRMCYSLKSVEPWKIKRDWPWAVRQTALYHSFDLVTGKALWIVVKGSHLIRERVQSATAPMHDGTSELSSFGSTASSLTSSLAMHLVLCDWCDEDWRWYLTFLEKRLQKLTRRSLIVDITKSPSFIEPPSFQAVRKPTTSFRRTLSELTKRTLSTSRKFTSSGSTLQEKTKYQPSFPQPTLVSPIDPSLPQLPPQLPPGMGGPSLDRSSDEIFSSKTLQQVQFIEDKTNEVLLILEANIKIVTGIKAHYHKVINSESCPAELKDGCKAEFSHFEKRIDNIVGDLEIQHSGAQTLLRLLENRKSLLSGLLNLRNIEASKELAAKSQYSAKKMEAMTEAMHLLAVKTKQETVSMRIITLVTLFFLPGTFISTIMSTDIIKFQDSQHIFSLGALQLYLAITLPLMALTFAAWWLVYWYINRRQESQAFGGRFSGWLP